MPRSSKIRVLIADDHAVVREGLATILSRQKDLAVVGEAADGVEAVALWKSLKPDVLLLDLRMPNQDGFGVIEELMPLKPTPRILVMTTYDGDEDIRRALRAGAKAYLLKDAPREEIWAAVRRTHSGETTLAPQVAISLADSLSRPELTPRELAVLQLVALGRSNKEIGASLSITEGTAKIHVNSLLRKLGAAGRTEAVAVAVRRGIVKLH